MFKRIVAINFKAKRKEVKKMRGLIGFGSITAFSFLVIIFCIFCGIFVRLGRIEIILKKMAIHQGAIEKEAPPKALYT